MSSSLDQKLLGIMRSVERRLLSMPGVVAVGIGPKIAGGRQIPVPALAVFVLKKLPLGSLPQEQRIPDEISGVKTDVIEAAGEAVLHEFDPDQLDPDCSGYPIFGDPEKYKAGQTFRFGDGPDALEGGVRIGVNKTRLLSTLVEKTTSFSGTLGFFATTTDTDPPTQVFITCQHVVEWFKGTVAGIPIGQPTAQALWRFLPCCNDQIGVVMRALLVADVDAAAVALNPGITWKAEVHDGSRQWPPGGPPGQPPGTPPALIENANNSALAGVVTGRHDVSTDELINLVLAGQVYEVQKRGYKTGVTKGQVTHAHFSGLPVNLFELDGDPQRQLARTTSDDLRIVSLSPELIWSCSGDSGSAVLNTSGEIVGLHWGADTQANVSGRPAFSSRIENVMSELKITPATASQKGLVQTAPPNNLANVPSASPLRQDAIVEQALGTMRRSVRGRRYLDNITLHGPEIQRLGRENPRVAAAWRRYRGWELASAFLAGGSNSQAKIPNDLRRMAWDDCLQNLGRVVEPRASKRLAEDLRRMRLELQGASGRTWAELLGEEL